MKAKRVLKYKKGKSLKHKKGKSMKKHKKSKSMKKHKKTKKHRKNKKGGVLSILKEAIVPLIFTGSVMKLKKKSRK